jgi:hypothetical protein
LTREEQGNPWPRLQALYLLVGDQHWLEQIPKFKELQILELKRLPHNIPTINQIAIENIAKCQDLRVIDAVFHELNNVEMLLDIAHSCPLLQKVSVRLLH